MRTLPPSIQRDRIHTVGNRDLSDSSIEEQEYEICGISRPAARYAVLWHATLQSGPITASTGPSSSMRLRAASACAGSQSTSAQVYTIFASPSGPACSFAASTASEMAPAEALPSGQDVEVGTSTARWSSSAAVATTAAKTAQAKRSVAIHRAYIRDEAARAALHM
jgi:hypothetical protein